MFGMALLARLVWIAATYFCCGVLIDSKDVVVEAAPIVAWATGKPYSKIIEFLKGRKALIDCKILDNNRCLW